MEDLPAVQSDGAGQRQHRIINRHRALAGAGYYERVKARIDFQPRGGLLARRELANVFADRTAGDSYFVAILRRNMFPGLGELAADHTAVSHQVLIGFSGDDVGIEDGGGDFFLGGGFHRDAGGISA